MSGLANLGRANFLLRLGRTDGAVLEETVGDLTALLSPRIAAAPELRQPSTSYFVETRSNLDDPALRATWIAFEPSASPFQRLSFVEGLYRHAAKAKTCEPLVVTVREHRAGPIILIAALARRVRFGLTIIGSADCNLCDYFIPLTPPDRLFNAREVQLIWAEICRALRPADAIIIKKIPDQIFGRPNPAMQIPRLQPMHASARSVRLDAGPYAYPGWRKRSAFKDAAKKARRLKRQGTIAFECIDCPADVAVAMQQFVAHRAPRFDRMRRTDLLREASTVEFYRALAERGLNDGSVQIVRLSIDGEMLAVAYLLLHGHAMSMVMLTMTSQARWESFSPGLVATRMIAEWAEARGYSFLDVSVGEFSYKSRLVSWVRPIYELNTALSTLGVLAVANAALRRRYRAWVQANPSFDRLVRHALGK